MCSSDLETEKIPNTINTKKSRPRHTVVKIPKSKEQDKNLESSKREMALYGQRNNSNYTRFLIRINGDQEEVPQLIKGWKKKFRILYSEKIVFRN